RCPPGWAAWSVGTPDTGRRASTSATPGVVQASAATRPSVSAASPTVVALAAAVADLRHPADAGLPEHGPERDHRPLALRRRADGAHAVVGGHDDDRAGPAPAGVEIVEQAGDGGVGGPHGPGVVGALGSVYVAGAIDVAE